MVSTHYLSNLGSRKKKVAGPPRKNNIFEARKQKFRKKRINIKLEEGGGRATKKVFSAPLAIYAIIIVHSGLPKEIIRCAKFLAK